MGAERGKPLRILGLHGYAQNGEFFRARTGALRKAIKAEFHFIDAPYAARASFITDATDGANGRGPALGWWDFEGASRPAASSRYVGLDETLSSLRHTIETEGPFDGILGFSQGATVAAMLCLLSPAPPPVSFVVLVAAFLPRDLEVQRHFSSGACDGIPTLHIMGEDDQLVPMESSAAVASCFAGATTATHPGGHAVPASAPIRSALKSFVQSAMGPHGGQSADSAKPVQPAGSAKPRTPHGMPSSRLSEATAAAPSPAAVQSVVASHLASVAIECEARWRMWGHVRNA